MISQSLTRRSKSPSPELNLTSLIDVLFIVLLFLLLSTTFKEFTFVRVDLPESTTGERISTQVMGPLVISVNEEGQVFLEDRMISLDELIDQLRFVGRADETEIILAADEHLDYGQVIDIMDRLRRAGYYALSLETLTVSEASLAVD